MTKRIELRSIILNYIFKHNWDDYNNYSNSLTDKILETKPNSKENIRKLLNKSSSDFFNYNEISRQKFNKYFPYKNVLLLLRNISDVNENIKVLFLASNPLDTCRLRLDEEVREIEEAIRLSDLRDKIQLEQKWAVRISDLQDYILKYEPDIVHFSGHGSHNNKIIFENNIGESIEVPPEALAKLFKIIGVKTKVVLLNACYSKEQAKAIAKYVPYVIGMKDSILDETAKQFSKSFYRAIGYGKSTEIAFELAKNQIELENIPESDIPELIK
jgi:hypothetical protein